MNINQNPAMPICTARKLVFSPLKRRKIETEFTGGDITSDASVLLFRQIDQHTNLLLRVAQQISDSRDPDKMVHHTLELLRQQVFAIANGYEDNNDHQSLRNDIAFQTAV